MPEDELLTHQIVDTFATVSQTDPSWTEKIWTRRTRATTPCRSRSASAVREQRRFRRGGGRVPRDRPVDVRAGRRLSSDPSSTDIGPIHYGVVDPLKWIRIRLRAKPSTPRSHLGPSSHAGQVFSNVRRSPRPTAVPMGAGSLIMCCVSARLARRRDGSSSTGVRTEFRRVDLDHSWGLRPGVGKPIPGLSSRRSPHRPDVTWCPMTLSPPDGSAFSSLSLFFQQEKGEGFESSRYQAEQQNGDGTARPFAEVRTRPAL